MREDKIKGKKIYEKEFRKLELKYDKEKKEEENNVKKRYNYDDLKRILR
jgi:hypothetical protein